MVFAIQYLRTIYQILSLAPSLSLFLIDCSKDCNSGIVDRILGLLCDQEFTLLRISKDFNLKCSVITSRNIGDGFFRVLSIAKFTVAI